MKRLSAPWLVLSVVLLLVQFQSFSANQAPEPMPDVLELRSKVRTTDNQADTDPSWLGRDIEITERYWVSEGLVNASLQGEETATQKYPGARKSAGWVPQLRRDVETALRRHLAGVASLCDSSTQHVSEPNLMEPPRAAPLLAESIARAHTVLVVRVIRSKPGVSLPSTPGTALRSSPLVEAEVEQIVRGGNDVSVGQAVRFLGNPILLQLGTETLCEEESREAESYSPGERLVLFAAAKRGVDELLILDRIALLREQQLTFRRDTTEAREEQLVPVELPLAAGSDDRPSAPPVIIETLKTWGGLTIERLIWVSKDLVERVLRGSAAAPSASDLPEGQEQRIRAAVLALLRREDTEEASASSQGRVFESATAGEQAELVERLRTARALSIGTVVAAEPGLYVGGPIGQLPQPSVRLTVRITEQLGAPNAANGEEVYILDPQPVLELVGRRILDASIQVNRTLAVGDQLVVVDPTFNESSRLMVPRALGRVEAGSLLHRNAAGSVGSFVVHLEELRAMVPPHQQRK